MCQDYEREKRVMSSLDRYEEVKGFASAFAGKPITAGPDFSLFKDSWEHGWRCFHGRLFPLGIETNLYIDNRKEAREAERVFKRTGDLPTNLVKHLSNYSN